MRKNPLPNSLIRVKRALAVQLIGFPIGILSKRCSMLDKQAASVHNHNRAPPTDGHCLDSGFRRQMSTVHTESISCSPQTCRCTAPEPGLCHRPMLPGCDPDPRDLAYPHRVRDGQRAHRLSAVSSGSLWASSKLSNAPSGAQYIFSQAEGYPYIDPAENLEAQELGPLAELADGASEVCDRLAACNASARNRGGGLRVQFAATLIRRAGAKSDLTAG